MPSPTPHRIFIPTPTATAQTLALRLQHDLTAAAFALRLKSDLERRGHMLWFDPEVTSARRSAASICCLRRRARETLAICHKLFFGTIMK